MWVSTQSVGVLKTVWHSTHESASRADAAFAERGSVLRAVVLLAR